MFGNPYFTRYTREGIRRTFKIVCRHRRNYSTILRLNTLNKAAGSGRYLQLECACVRACVWCGGVGGLFRNVYDPSHLFFSPRSGTHAGRRTEHVIKLKLSIVCFLLPRNDKSCTLFVRSKGLCTQTGEKSSDNITARVVRSRRSVENDLCVYCTGAGNRFEILKPSKQSDRPCSHPAVGGLGRRDTRRVKVQYKLSPAHFLSVARYAAYKKPNSGNFLPSTRSRYTAIISRCPRRTIKTHFFFFSRNPFQAFLNHRLLSQRLASGTHLCLALF